MFGGWSGRVEFGVIDKRTQQDITRPVLLQVIAELEQRNGTVLSQDFLAQLIRSHNHDAGLEGVLSSYLEQSLRLFLSEKPPAGDPAAAASQLAHQNHQRWHSAQEEIFRTLIKARATPPTPTPHRPQRRGLHADAASPSAVLSPRRLRRLFGRVDGASRGGCAPAGPPRAP